MHAFGYLTLCPPCWAESTAHKAIAVSSQTVDKQTSLAHKLSLLEMSPRVDIRRPRDVRAASSSVPWRNAQPTEPPNETPLEPQQPAQPKIRDLVGYTAVLSKKARNSAEDRTLGIVEKVRKKENSIKIIAP